MNSITKARPWRLAAAILGIIFVGVLLFEMMQIRVKPTSKPPTIIEVDPVTTTTLTKPKQPEKEFTIWSTSYHISPIECLKHFLENDFRKKTGRKVKIINKSLSGHCHIPKTCAKDLKVLNSGNGGFTPCREKIGEKLYEAYKQDDEFASVDLVMCDHNIAMCELYMAFDKPMVLQATTRYELWRHSPSEWQNLNQNLEKIVAKKHNSIVANNLFDANYVQYFTGLKIPVFDSYCAYTADEGTYNPTRSEFLIGPSRSSASGAFFETINRLIAQDGNKIQIKGIRQLYSHFKYSDLAAHPAIIIIPYQVSVMSFFEYYRMNIPMYAPSIELLTKWHVDTRILSERTWGLVGSGGNVGAKGSPSEMKKHPNANLPNFDPNNDVDYTSVLFWNQYSDFYQWPNIITFNSWEDLFAKLKGTTLDDYKEISKKMAMYNAEVSDSLVRKWLDVIERAESKKDKNQKSTLTFEQAMKNHWNIDMKC